MAEDVGGLAADGTVGLKGETGDAVEEFDDGVGSPCEIGKRRGCVEWSVFDDCYQCLFCEELFVVRTQHYAMQNVLFLSELGYRERLCFFYEKIKIKHFF